MELLLDFQLTLPLQTEPLDQSRRKDHVRWREEALSVAREKLNKAERARLLKRGLHWGCGDGKCPPKLLKYRHYPSFNKYRDRGPGVESSGLSHTDNRFLQCSTMGGSFPIPSAVAYVVPRPATQKTAAARSRQSSY